MADFRLSVPSHLKRLRARLQVSSGMLAEAIMVVFGALSQAYRLLRLKVAGLILPRSRNRHQCRALLRPASQIHLLRRYPFCLNLN